MPGGAGAGRGAFRGVSAGRAGGRREGDALMAEGAACFSARPRRERRFARGEDLEGLRYSSRAE